MQVFCPCCGTKLELLDLSKFNTPMIFGRCIFCTTRYSIYVGLTTKEGSAQIDGRLIHLTATRWKAN